MFIYKRIRHIQRYQCKIHGLLYWDGQNERYGRRKSGNMEISYIYIYISPHNILIFIYVKTIAWLKHRKVRDLHVLLTWLAPYQSPPAPSCLISKIMNFENHLEYWSVNHWSRYLDNTPCSINPIHTLFIYYIKISRCRPKIMLYTYPYILLFSHSVRFNDVTFSVLYLGKNDSPRRFPESSHWVLHLY